MNHINAPLSWGMWSGPEGVAAGDGGAQILRSIFAVNVFSYVLLATAALPALEASKGSLVVVSSATGKMGMPLTAAYSSTKHALHGFFDSLRHEMVLRGVDVSISLCVLGNIATLSNVEGTKGQLNPNLTRHPVHLAARSILVAGAARVREAYYPAAELVPVTLLRPWMPHTLDWIVRKIVIVNL
ncbi:hypothetical protein T492DRAFT_1023535 [Pavlovales sp. CCMP2436]|nr:hypothetical protein T492DRAFT_1023535 [Pavlovales sp. CCMP2436]|mmetsp:Transcript_30065/g.75522  ORF Transcript_30065/g.75522 Transcript_30065/m.75522 type:complete len:185 (+) Transcript_30065:621-1175(+)